MRDPVCGMDVDEINAKKVVYSGDTYYFCTDECVQKFKQSPDNYMQTRPAPRPPQGQRRQDPQGGRAVGS